MSLLVMDACSMINLSKVDALDLVFQIERHEYFVGEQVIDECDGRIAVLNNSIVTGRVTTLDDAHIPASRFLNLLAEHGLGDGETECLMHAQVNQELVICTDDGAARRIATNLLGRERVVGSIRLLRDCVADSYLQEVAAFELYRGMIARGAFLPILDAVQFANA